MPTNNPRNGNPTTKDDDRRPNQQPGTTQAPTEKRPNDDQRNKPGMKGDQ